MTQVTQAPEARQVPQMKRLKKLAEADFFPSEAAQLCYTCYPPVETTREDVLDPAFWTHVAKRLRPMAEIKVMPKDGSWYGWFLCIFADDVRAVVEELLYKSFDTTKASDLDAEVYFVKWISPPSKYGVLRKADRQLMKDGFDSKAAAVNYMQELAKARR